MEVTLLSVDRVHSLDGFDAVVLGSAVYMGRWRNDARNLVVRQGAMLRRMPVWLFSSGPVGDPPKPIEEPLDTKDMVLLTNARDHRLFAGKLARNGMHLADRAVAVALRAPEGDFRNWAEIGTWAGGIADTLAAPAVTGQQATSAGG